MRVLIVDDSVVFRSQIRTALENYNLITIAGTANNGKVALQRLTQASVDVVTLDMEMPEMGGLETIREIRKAKFPVRIIVFSSHTKRGSEMALDALAAGADDFVAKPSGEDMSPEKAVDSIRAQLLPKIQQFLPNQSDAEAPTKSSFSFSPSALASQAAGVAKRDLSTFLPLAIVIGSSTGGPPALERVLAGLSKPLRVPIFITQHMPPVFTASLAKRIQELTGVPSTEGTHMMPVENNHIYVAPGDFHMGVKKKDGALFIVTDQGPSRNSVRPCVDILFEQASIAFGTRTMAIVLTGMGEDGLVGCQAIKKAGGGVMIQNKESCIVFGMPGAVFKDNCFDQQGDLEAINQAIKRMVS